MWCIVSYYLMIDLTSVQENSASSKENGMYKLHGHISDKLQIFRGKTLQL